MEIAKIVPEELLDKFRSKKDLYMMLMKDRKYILKLIWIVHYFLPPFHKCPLHFLRSVLDGTKKVSICSIINKDAKTKWNY